MTSDLPPEAEQAWRDYNAAAQIGDDAYAPFMSGWLAGRYAANEAVPMILTCPSCGGRHLDEGEFATKVHHTHACQHCGIVWRPALVPTVGVQFLPGFKNAANEAERSDG